MEECEGWQITNLVTCISVQDLIFVITDIITEGNKDLNYTQLITES